MIAARLAWEAEAAPRLAQLRKRDRDPSEKECELLDAEPELDPALSIAVKAYRDTSTCRSVGMSLGPIPQTAIDAWCDRRGFDFESAEFLSDAIRYADFIELDRMDRIRKEQS